MVLNFHRERHYAVVAAASAIDAVNYARSLGRDVRLACVLDRPDRDTLQAVNDAPIDWAFVEKLDNGDLGKSRNDAVDMVDAGAIAFMDGDDLCGHFWLAAALTALDHVAAPAVLHPEFVYYFDETDFLAQSQSILPSASSKSFWLRHVGSDDPTFNTDLLRFNNVFTSNSVAWRDVYVEYPFLQVDDEKGFGVEDWTWNAMTLTQGIPHLVVPDTVHMVRVKARGSLGQDNLRRGLLPDLLSAFGESTREWA
jgi:hypothetical protein